LSKIQKLQTKLKEKFEKLLQDYGQEILLNGQPITAIYIKEEENLPIEQFGIVPTSQTTIYLPIDTPITETDKIEIEGKLFKVSKISIHYRVFKIVILEEVDID